MALIHSIKKKEGGGQVMNKYGKQYTIFSIPTSPATLLRILNFKGWKCNPNPSTTPSDIIMELPKYELICPLGHQFTKSLHGIAHFPYCPECGE